jgi:hypothetical protein
MSIPSAQVIKAPHAAEDARGVVRGNARVNVAGLGTLYMESRCLNKTGQYNVAT